METIFDLMKRQTKALEKLAEQKSGVKQETDKQGSADESDNNPEVSDDTNASDDQSSGITSGPESSSEQEIERNIARQCLEFVGLMLTKTREIKVPNMRGYSINRTESETDREKLQEIRSLCSDLEELVKKSEFKTTNDILNIIDSKVRSHCGEEKKHDGNFDKQKLQNALNGLANHIKKVCGI